MALMAIHREARKFTRPNPHRLPAKRRAIAQLEAWVETKHNPANRNHKNSETLSRTNQEMTHDAGQSATRYFHR